MAVDRELAAMATVVEALSGLDERAAQRVIAWARSKYGDVTSMDAPPVGKSTGGKGGPRPAAQTTSTSRPARRVSREVPAAFAHLEELPVSLEGVVAFHQVPMKRDKVLWALMMAKDLGVATLTAGDVAWLTDRLGDGVQAKHFGVHYGSLHTAGLANQSISNQGFRITPQGEGYLRALQPRSKT